MTRTNVSSDAFDVVVIGAGPGGYVAAIRAAQYGLQTAIVERGELGGVCLNWGCIPTKALLHGADTAHAIAAAGRYGFDVPAEVGFDMQQLVKFSRSVVSRLVSGVSALLTGNGVEVIRGSAVLSGKGELTVTADDQPIRELQADHIIVATGARPRVLPGITPDGDRIWTSTDALSPKKLPESLVIIGSGAIGIEFASLYGALGTEVTVLEALDRVLPAEDAAVSAAVVRQLRSRGIRCEAGVTVGTVTADGTGVSTTFTVAGGASETIRSEHLLVAAGVVPNTEGLGLAELGVGFERGFIAIDEWCRTGVAGLYAIGDVAGGPCLAHKASHEALICVDHIAGAPGVRQLDRWFVPRCTYSRPQIASIGRTEQQARALGRPIEVGVFDLAANGKALAQGEGIGFVKTIFDAESGELLGAHMVGPEVTELIEGFSIAHGLEATAESLAEIIFPHPSVSEAMHESVLAALGRAIHSMPTTAPTPSQTRTAQLV